MGMALGLWAPGVGAAERRMLVVAAGEVTGVYFPAAGAVCRVVNKDRPRGTTCSVMPSSGSAANVAALRAGEADLAVLQSRALMLARDGEEAFREAGAMPDIKALMALHGEAAVVVARPDSNINTVADLKGKRVNLGRPGSFQRAMGEAVLDAAGLSQGDLSPLVELDLAEQGRELCEGNIDAAIFTGIHPMPEIEDAIESCSATLVPVKGKTVEAFVKKAPWLSRLSVKGGTYDGHKDELPSIGVRAVLAAGPQVSAEDAHGVLKAIWANFPAFTRLHPALRGLTKAEAARDGIPVRLHEGAERFFAEQGGK